eukprot:1159605-Pelagomonas_calceolata.AAC.1
MMARQFPVCNLLLVVRRKYKREHYTTSNATCIKDRLPNQKASMGLTKGLSILELGNARDSADGDGAVRGRKYHACQVWLRASKKRPLTSEQASLTTEDGLVLGEG